MKSTAPLRFQRCVPYKLKSYESTANVPQCRREEIPTRGFLRASHLERRQEMATQARLARLRWLARFLVYAQYFHKLVPLLYWYRTSTFFFFSSVTESLPKTSRGTHQNIRRTFSGLVVDRTQRGYQSREMYLRVKAVERRKLLASPEAPVRPEFGFEAGTSGLAPPAPAAGTSTAVGYPTTPPSAAHPPAAMTRSSRGLSAVSVITAAFWVGMGVAVMAAVGRVVAW